MEPLQHDPRTKQQVRDALYDFLYSPVQQQFKTRLDVLIVRNTLLSGTRHKSFSYKGQSYNCDVGPPPRKANRLLPQLRSEMDDYLKDLKELNSIEVPYVVGFINQVLNASNDLGDYLRLLPDATHRPLERLIASCPCQTKQLSDQRIAEIKAQNKVSIDLIKKRMVMNLLL